MKLKKLGKFLRKNFYDADFEGLTDEEIGEMVREEYADLFDPEFEMLLLEKYPSFDKKNTQLATVNRPLPTVRLNSEALEQVDNLRGKLKPSNGWFYAWRQTIKSERNIKLLEVLTRNEIAVIEHGEVLERAARRKQSEIDSFERYLQEHQLELMGIQAKAMMMKNAVDLKLPVEYYGEYKKEELLTDLRIKEYLATEGNSKKEQQKHEELQHQREIEKINLASTNKIKEHEEKARIDLENETKSAHEKLRFAITADHLTDQKQIEYIQDLITEQHIKISNTKADSNIPEDAKQPIIESIERTIKMYQEQQDEAHKRIIQSKA